MIRALARLFAVPDKLAMLGLVRGMAGQIQLSTAVALMRCGALRHLASPRTFEELVADTGAEAPEVLRHLLDLGVGRRLLRRRDGCYEARSRLVRCIVRDPNGPVASMLEEVATYHHEVFDQLPERLRGAPAQAHLDRYGALVAQSSRIMAPWIEGFMTDVLGGRAGRRILELGCGSGAYVVRYAALHPDHHGVGVDLDPRVVEAARDRIADAGLGERFRVRQGDMRAPGDWPDGPFDVVTAHQNVYYFDAGERAGLWRRCREHLTATGRLAIVTPTSGGPMSDYFSLILLSTAGCHRLPSIGDLVAELEAAGFAHVHRERLVPGDELWGIEARMTLSDAAPA